VNDEGMFKLAVAMHDSPGVYALLIGSGLSTAAGIPTGQQITLELIRRIAVREKEKPGKDMEAWYRQKFGASPSYSGLLDSLTSNPAGRGALLRRYIEPTDEERAEHKKVPTDAHKAISKLVKEGLIRLILTTNFDRLLEQALQDEGIHPDVVATDDALKGAVPYVHFKCVLVKLHGDYRDTRLKNTESELANYSDELNEFLDRVLDDFGLVVCGWSAEWDVALRAAILRAPNRRFSTYWLSLGSLTDAARDVVEARRAIVLPISGADAAFERLYEQVTTLRELNQPSPLSTSAAVATVKRYIPDHVQRIRLYDLITSEVEEAYERIRQFEPVHKDETLSKDDIYQRALRYYEATVGRLAAMLGALGYHDTGENAYLLTQSIERLAQQPKIESYPMLDALLRYPALLLMYTSGISALAGGRYRNLAATIKDPTRRDPNGDKRVPAIEALTVPLVFSISKGGDKLVPWPNANIERLPAYSYIRDVIRPSLKPYIPEDRKFREMFDIFEFLLALNRAWLGHKNSEVLSYGLFVYLLYTIWDETDGDKSRYEPIGEFLREGSARGEDWGLIKAGFFEGSTKNCITAVESLKAIEAGLKKKG